MKAWKIIAVAAVAVISVALITSYAFAMGGQNSFNPNGTYGPYSSHSSAQGPAGGMMGGGMGGIMGNGYPSNRGYQAYPQQTPYGQEYRQLSDGHGGCP